MKRIPLVLAFSSLVFLLSALVVWQTISQNREEIQVIQNPKTQKIENSEIQTSKNQDPKIPRIDELGIENGDQSKNILGKSDQDLSRLSVNSASEEELDTIPGVGTVTAQKIIDGRPWDDLEEVLNLISKRYREEARGKIRL